MPMMDMDCCAHPDAGAGEDPIEISMWRCMKRMRTEVGSGGYRMMVKAPLSDNGFVLLLLCAADHAPE